MRAFAGSARGVLRPVGRTFGVVFRLAVGVLRAGLCAMASIASGILGFVAGVFHVLPGGLSCDGREGEGGSGSEGGGQKSGEDLAIPTHR